MGHCSLETVIWEVNRFMIYASAMMVSGSDDNYRLHLFVINDKNDRDGMAKFILFYKKLGRFRTEKA
jgi:hypothetical protein